MESIILNRPQLVAARAGKKTHICLAAWRKRGERSTVIDGQPRTVGGENALGLPSRFQKLQDGELLWVQEEVSQLLNARDHSQSRAFYKADLPANGMPPIPGGARHGIWSTRSIDASKMPQDHSRYTIKIVSHRILRAHDLTLEEAQAEGSAFPTDTPGQVWQRHYGFTMPYAENPEVVGIFFEFVHRRWNGDPSPPWEKDQRVKETETWRTGADAAAPAPEGGDGS